MTDKQRAAIEKHGEALLVIFPDATERDPVELCKKVRRIEAAAHRHAERMCSEEGYYNRWTDEHGDDIRDTQLERRLRKLLGSERAWLNGDPRGYALKVDLAEGERLHTDWGGYGIIAPEIGRDGL